MSKELQPINVDHCQALIPNGNTFMTLGGVPGLIECRKVPQWLATEVKVREGMRGSMALCHDCKDTCETQMPGQVSFQKIERGTVT